jgi:hypothetical protein
MVSKCIGYLALISYVLQIMGTVPVDYLAPPIHLGTPRFDPVRAGGTYRDSNLLRWS